MVRWCLFILLVTGLISGIAQSPRADSLRQCIKKNSDPDQLSVTYTELSWELSFHGKNKEAVQVAKKAIQLADEAHNGLAKASAWNALASAYDELSDFKQAEKYFKLSLHYFNRTKNIKRQASTLNNLGTIYFNQSNYKLALDCFYKALKIKEQLKDITGIANCYTNMANVYYELLEFTKSVELLEKAIQLYRKSGDREGLAGALSNVGGIYAQLEKYKKAIAAQKEALSIYKVFKLPEGLSSCYSNVAYYFKCTNQYDSAEFYYQKCIDISIEIGDKITHAGTLVNISDLFFRKKQFKKSLEKLLEAETLYKQVNTAEGFQNLYRYLSNTCYELGKYKEAMDYSRKAYRIKDSLFNIENSKVLSDLKTNYEVSKKEAELKAVANAEKENLELKASKERQKQQLIIYAVGAGLLVSMIFSFFIFKGLQRNKRAGKIIALQKKQVEDKNHLIEEKQKEINDSINYAQRIQNSFLTSENEFRKNLSEFFILFQPKDVVSGDFYWGHMEDKRTFICVADSTGHGIPGAFMSLLNISLLNEATLSRGFKTSHEILNFVRRILIIGLRADESGQGGNDGMDCAFMIIDHESLMLEYCGANNPVWISRSGEMIELQPQKMPVGRSPLQHIDFTPQYFQLQKGDMVFAFSDGFADQFGGPKAKKFKYANLQKLFLENSQLSCADIKHKLDQTFTQWKGNLEQVDDVCVMGIKI